ncbi:sulfotransferase family 2 domain-containing protein [Tamlana crocina]
MALQISDKHKCIFIHIPKTGGSTIEESCLFDDQRKKTGEAVGGHATAIEIKNLDTSKFLSYYKFSFVRNPYSRLVSAFFYFARGGNNEKDYYWFDKIFKQFDNDFEAFCLQIDDIPELKKIPHFRLQHEFICDENFNLLVNEIGRQENLNSEANKIFKKLGLEFKKKYLKKSNNRHYSKYYNKKTQEMVYNYYKLDFELFDYKYKIKRNVAHYYDLEYLQYKILKSIKSLINKVKLQVL